MRRTEAGFHPECEPTDIDAQSPLAFNLKTGINQARSIDRIPFSPRLLTSKADGYQFNFARLLSLR